MRLTSIFLSFLIASLAIAAASEQDYFEPLGVFNRDSYYEILKVPESASYYEILGVDSNASKQAITKAYKNLSLKFHPDKLPAAAYLLEHGKDVKVSVPEWVKDKYGEIFKIVKNAYEILSDAEKRKKYNKKLFSEVESVLNERYLSERQEELNEIVKSFRLKKKEKVQKNLIQQLEQFFMDLPSLWTIKFFENSRPQKEFKPILISKLKELVAVSRGLYLTFSDRFLPDEIKTILNDRFQFYMNKMSDSIIKKLYPMFFIKEIGSEFFNSFLDKIEKKPLTKKKELLPEMLKSMRMLDQAFIDRLIPFYTGVIGDYLNEQNVFKALDVYQYLSSKVDKITLSENAKKSMQTIENTLKEKVKDSLTTLSDKREQLLKISQDFLEAIEKKKEEQKDLAQKYQKIFRALPLPQDLGKLIKKIDDERLRNLKEIFSTSYILHFILIGTEEKVKDTIGKHAKDVIEHFKKAFSDAKPPEEKEKILSSIYENHYPLFYVGVSGKDFAQFFLHAHEFLANSYKNEGKLIEALRVINQADNRFDRIGGKIGGINQKGFLQDDLSYLLRTQRPAILADLLAKSPSTLQSLYDDLRALQIAIMSRPKGLE